MTTATLTYIIIAIVVAHFLFAVGYLVYKIAKAPKSEADKKENS
jgi:hypothetical protein